ncbi:cytochrome c oxidase subunit II [Mesorhizobium sp. M9A.F.Ca.ET.002.03.1.2]|uniref:cytochrome c oxidase subunit II n=1 Tax=Mesorhizobium sp. M9A.F.Ca.ET.002.03.1.2 TaxID=2493668 RepID=UPI000F75ED1A|nr:cytochrome c oxidase subunit II [Mesorhizobium sp. M9A.F.Ca.ET.002.03.1.2]AZO00877.1 cytochrome c oxidase subunit II [Mesorhizobium sp. M9A.F.Ca.ET.002.03.1.2]
MGQYFSLSAASLLLASYAGARSVLEPAGEEAQQIAILFWVMLSSGALIWLGVVALLLHAALFNRHALNERSAGRIILWGGVVFPSVTLCALLAYALWLMPGLRPFTQAMGSTALRIEITGRQFWWEVVYHPSQGPPVASANEIRLPVGERVELTLKSADEIHSFWIPPLGGKMDMIPGRTNRLSLMATKPGVFRGPCTEYCGTSHALMAFSAVAMEPEAFRSWLTAQAIPAESAGASGGALFLRHGCGSCHFVAGTDARGLIGPDLSHVGSRATVGAGILPNTEDAIARFIARPELIKPGSRMPAFDMLPPEDIRAIATWLRGLQ